MFKIFARGLPTVLPHRVVALKNRNSRGNGKSLQGPHANLEGQPFPCRLHVKVVEALTPETAVPILDMGETAYDF